MKYLKSSCSDLRIIFEQSITVKHLAESLASFDEKRMASDVREILNKKDWDVIGVRKSGAITGYACREDLNGGILGDYTKKFNKNIILEERAPLFRLLPVICKMERCFVSVFGSIGAIVTRGDLQKAPMRMWLFSLISLLEMQMLRLIRDYYPNDSWRGIISNKRLEEAENILTDRCKRNEEIDLPDCLQFCDKKKIFLYNEKLLKGSGLESKSKGEKWLKELEKLRNDLAHSQDIITGNWPEIVDLTEQAEKFLRKLEKM